MIIYNDSWWWPCRFIHHCFWNSPGWHEPFQSKYQCKHMHHFVRQCLFASHGTRIAKCGPWWWWGILVSSGRVGMGHDGLVEACLVSIPAMGLCVMSCHLHCNWHHQIWQRHVWHCPPQWQPATTAASHQQALHEQLSIGPTIFD